MEIKKIINLFRKVEGYIGLNAAYANEIAGFLEEYERRAENLVDYNADLNNQLSKAEVHIEMLEKQKEAMLKELCDKEYLISKAEGRVQELEIQLTKQQPEWISVEDDLPKEKGNYFAYNEKNDRVYILPADGETVPWSSTFGITHWMPLPAPPKPKVPTFKDVFLEKFPKAPLRNNGDPKACLAVIFAGAAKIACDDCNDCWNQPYFEEEEKE